MATCFNKGKLTFSFYENSKKILALGEFDLRKWFTNSRQLREKICETENDRPIDIKAAEKILGVDWDLENDKFVFTFDEIVSFVSTLAVTKRNILKITNMFFDPLGFLCPIVLQAKLIFNKVCILKTGWDSELPVEVEKSWKSFLNFLKNLNDISFDRCLFADQKNFVSIELHGFCDASETAYSAVIYARTIYKNKMTVKFAI